MLSRTLVYLGNIAGLVVAADMVIDLGVGPCIPSYVVELVWDKCLALMLACC